MEKKNNLFDNRIVSALAIIVITVSVLLVYKVSTNTNSIAKELTTPIDMESVDSTYCIACHTDEGIITDLALEEEEGDEAEGG